MNQTEMMKTDQIKENIQEAKTILNKAKVELVKTKKQFRILWICYFGIPCIMSFGALTFFAFKSSLNRDGEPLTFFDSISIWPTELIRLFSGFLAIYFILLAVKNMIHNSEDINKLFLGKGGTFVDGKAKQDYDNISRDWKFYQSLEKNKWLYIKTLLFATGYLFASDYFLEYCGRPPTPFRGEISNKVDKCVLIFSLFSMLFLTWFVINTIRNCRGFFSGIIGPKASWFASNILNMTCSIKETIDKIRCEKKDETCQKEYANCLAKYDKCITENILVQWKKIHIIAKRTEVIGKMLIYPFIVFALLLISRSKIFDNWTWPIPLVIVISLIISVTLYYASILFYDANAARKQLVTYLYQVRLYLMNIQIPTKFDTTDDIKSKLIEQKTEYVDNIIKDLQNLKSGAFSPLGHNPLTIAILAPLGGMGSIAILQYLPQLLNK